MSTELVPAGALVVRRPLMDGEQIIARFPNHYGASIVRHMGSYGSRDGLWELAVLRFKSESPEDFELTYSTPITDDVIGWQTDADILALCEQIAALPG